MHNKHIKVYTDAGWFTRGRIYKVTYKYGGIHTFEDIKTGLTITTEGNCIPDKYRIVSNAELWFIEYWMVLIALLLIVCLLISFSSCTKQPIELNQPQKTVRPNQCDLQYFTGLYVIVNKSPWLLLDTVRFTKDDVRMRAEYTQQTRVNDTPIYYHALATCDSLWTFSNEGFGINHIVRFDTSGILVDSLVIAGVGYGVNRYRRL